MDSKAKEALEKQVELLSRVSEEICQGDVASYPIEGLVALTTVMVNVISTLRFMDS